MTDANTLLLFNSSSGRAGEVNIEAVKAILERGDMKISALVADEFPALERKARDAMSPSLERIIVAGGDGTVSGFLPLALDAGVILGVIPCGTANDFAASLGIEAESFEDVAACLVSGGTRYVDVGVVDGEPFLNAVGVGLGSRITNELDDDEKQQFGVMAYGKKLLEAVSDRRRRLSLTLKCDEHTHREKVLQITVTNGLRYGGGMLAPDGAALDDGCLHVVTVKPGRLIVLIGLLPRFLTGRLRGTRRVKVRKAEHIIIDVHKKMDVTADGEIVTTTPCELSVRHNALQVMWPAEAPS